MDVIIILHLLVVLALCGLVLLQRSEGGGLGMGGSVNSFLSSRSKANALTRTTAILAALFFLTSIALAILGSRAGPARSIVDQQAPQGQGKNGILDQLPPSATAMPAAPAPAKPQVPTSR